METLKGILITLWEEFLNIFRRNLFGYIRITPPILAGRGACSRQIKRFEEVYGEKLEIPVKGVELQKIIDQAAGEGLDTYWPCVVFGLTGVAVEKDTGPRSLFEIPIVKGKENGIKVVYGGPRGEERVLSRTTYRKGELNGVAERLHYDLWGEYTQSEYLFASGIDWGKVKEKELRKFDAELQVQEEFLAKARGEIMEGKIYA